MPSGRFSREPITLSFPPFTPVVAWLVGINVGVFFLFMLPRLVPGMAGLSDGLAQILSLTPNAVSHGWIWQLATYDFVHSGLLSMVILSLMLWMWGAQLEQSLGRRRFLGLYFTGVIGAALVTVALAYAGVLGLAPGIHVAGAGAGLYGIYIAFGMLFGESEFMMFPFPVLIKAKYFVWILIVVTLAISLSQGAGAVPQLGGLLFGYLYVKMSQRVPARAYAGAYRSGRGAAPTPEPKRAPLMARWRDSYYRWKRRRAARKFEVYMRKHDREVFFDEHGNYIEPDARGDRENGEGKTPWVN